ncbi:hypothetical protein HY797_01370 [Candidatus Falkowbacteria bacterium]|nr:hypothetical protein [Candidatus Falkowbacteria bacterium]
MKNTIELPGKRYEGAEIKQQAELVDFIRENKVDSQEFSDAYLIALGSSPEINPNHPLRLTIFDVQSGKEIDEINIPEDIFKKYSKNDLAAILISSLSDYKNKKIEITFLGA